MNRRHFLRAAATHGLVVFLAGAACADGPKTPAGADAAKRRQLEREIAALEARMQAALPEFEREQHAWEAEVMQSAGAAKVREVPARIRAILALEPTEREAAQREEVAAYFRPRSKTLGALSRKLEAKRATLAALPPAARLRAPGGGGCAG